MKEVLKTRKYKAGYEVREIRYSEDDAYGGSPFVMKEAYTTSGDYIGGSKRAYRFCKIIGIAPEKIKPDGNICSIGFSEKDQKWYGWSHRAIFGFSVGSEVARGDCAYRPTDKDDFLEDCVRFWDDELHEKTTGEHSSNIPKYYEYGDAVPHSTDDKLMTQHKTGEVSYGVEEFGVQVNWEYSEDTPNEKIRGTISGVFSPYPKEYGKGEWIATTLEDAKQMAVDFSNGVS